MIDNSAWFTEDYKEVKPDLTFYISNNIELLLIKQTQFFKLKKKIFKKLSHRKDKIMSK